MKEKESLFANTTMAEKFLIIMLYIPVNLFAFYLLIRLRFNPNKLEEWRAWGAKEDAVVMDEHDMTDEEWLAKQEADELWWKENRVKMNILSAIGFVLLPPIMFYNWLANREESRKP